jgi:Mor family transcriptional regulator
MNEKSYSETQVKAAVLAACLLVPIDRRTAVEILDKTGQCLGRAFVSEPCTKAERNARIKAEWTGRNLALLMKRYNVSRRTIYRAVNR